MNRRSWATTAGAATAGALGFLALQHWPGMAGAWQFSRADYEQGAVWQLLSSQLVHLTAGHAWANAAGLAALLLISRRWVTLPRQAVALVGGALGVALVLALDSQCRYYAGASGALHGLLAGNIVWLWHHARRPSVPRDEGLAERRWAALMLALLLLKLWLQPGQGAPSAWSFPVYHPAHLAGALGGCLLSLVWGAVRAQPSAATQRAEPE